MPYLLSTSLYGHVSDVRGLGIFSGNGIISASRDGTAALWTERNGCYEKSVVFGDHSSYVTCATSLPPNENYPLGLIATGSNDSTISIYSPDSSKAVVVFVGHTGNVTSLQAIGNFEIASSSCDGTCKVWNILHGSHLTYSAIGHSLPFWDVLNLSCGFLVTASADKSIIVFDKETRDVARVLKGHDDCVRGLCAVDDQQFLSCSNDALIIQWNAVTGSIVRKHPGHLNFIYSIASSPSGLFASAGEGGLVLVWNNKQFEAILHPSQTVWCVAVLPNDDVVTGSSDGIVRVFTKDPSRVAPEDTIRSYEEQVNVARTSITSSDSNCLVGQELLEQPGKDENDVKFVREGSKVFCYSWDTSSKQWVAVGEFPAPVKPSARPKQVDESFDYTFNVELEEGMPPMKLHFNSGDDPQAVAHAFIAMYDLPPYYCDQIIEFILANTSSRCDSRQKSETIEGYKGLDAQLKMQKNFFPRLNFFLMKAANFDKIKLKVKEFAQAKYANDVIESIMSLTNPDSEPADNTVEEFFKMLQWPANHVFPILDIARLAVLNEKSNRVLCQSNNGSKLMHVLKTHLSQENNDVNAMLSLRTLANMTSHDSGQNILLEHSNDIYRILISRAELKNKKAQFALSAFLLNLTVLCYLKKDAERMADVQKAIETLVRGLTEDDALFFTLVALGSSLSLTKQPFAEETISLLENLVPIGNSEKVVACSRQILDLISLKTVTNRAGDEALKNNN